MVENLINIVLAIALAGSYGVLGLGASFAIAYTLSGVVGPPDPCLQGARI